MPLLPYLILPPSDLASQSDHRPWTPVTSPAAEQTSTPAEKPGSTLLESTGIDYWNRIKIKAKVPLGIE